MIPARFAVFALFVPILFIASFSCSGEKVEKSVVEQSVERLGNAKKDAEKIKMDIEKADAKKLEEVDKDLNDAKKSLEEAEKKY